MAVQTLHRKELLEVANAVAREKGIQLEEVVRAMILAFQKAAQAKYGPELDIRTEIDPMSGEIRFWRCRTVVLEVEDPAAQISLDEAREEEPERAEGDVLRERLPPIDLGRVAAQTIKQTIVQQVREAERTRQYEEYKDRVGEIVSGLVKRVEYGNVLVDLTRAEGVLRRDDTIPRETHRIGDRVRAYIYEVRNDTRGTQILLSRAHPQFMSNLFAQEVPEVYEGVIEIKSVARDPGSRAKIAVISHDSSIDPVGACVGMRGSRVQAVVGELQGEKIDIVPWSADPATFVVNALAPAEVSKVILDEEKDQMEVVVSEEQLSLAIGRRGQNVRLASQLTGWQIDLLTEEEESARRKEDFKRRAAFFVESLDVDDTIAELLAAEGFAGLEQIGAVPPEELAQIEGFDESLAREITERARQWVEERDRAFEEERLACGVSDELAAAPGLSPAMVARLGRAGVLTSEDFAGLSRDEFIDIVEELAPPVEDIDQIIMAARAHWFPPEEDEGEGEGEGAPADPADPAAAAAAFAPADGAPDEAAAAPADAAAPDGDAAAAPSAGEAETPGAPGAPSSPGAPPAPSAP